MAYILFQKCHVYKTTLNRCDEKANAEKAWTNFKLYFRTAYKALRRTGSLTKSETMDRTQVMNLVSDGVQELLQCYQPSSNESNILQDSSQTETLPSQVFIQETSQHANSAVSDITLQTMH